MKRGERKNFIDVRNFPIIDQVTHKERPCAKMRKAFPYSITRLIVRGVEHVAELNQSVGNGDCRLYDDHQQENLRKVEF